MTAVSDKARYEGGITSQVDGAVHGPGAHDLAEAVVPVDDENVVAALEGDVGRGVDLAGGELLDVRHDAGHAVCFVSAGVAAGHDFGGQLRVVIRHPAGREYAGQPRRQRLARSAPRTGRCVVENRGHRSNLPDPGRHARTRRSSGSSAAAPPASARRNGGSEPRWGHPRTRCLPPKVPPRRHR